MNKKLKILLAALLIAGVFTQDKICQHLGIGQAKHHEGATEVVQKKKLPPPVSSVKKEAPKEDYFKNDSIYRWDDELFDWVVVPGTANFQAQVIKASTSPTPATDAKPIKIEWKVLMDIQYRLKYFAEVEMEVYAPVFSEAVQALHEKEVIIEGFVIPFYEDGLVSLSYNPFSSCFFCGKASPASVLSMYMKKKTRKRYKTDDFKKFKGTLHLNEDDPNEFYYILRDAKEVR